MKTDLTDVDITEEILKIAEEQVGEGEKDKKRRAEEIEDEGLRVERLQRQLSKVEAMVSELESGIENDASAVQRVKDRIDEREDEEEFKRNKDRDTIDYKDYKRVKKVLEDYESMVSRLAIERQALLATYFQLKDLVDHQQMVHDEDRIVSAVKDIQENLEEIYEKNLDSTTDIFQKQVESLYSNIEELQEEMNSIKKTQAKRDGELRDAINNLSTAIENMPSEQDQRPRQRQKPQDNGNRRNNGNRGNGGTQDTGTPESSTTTPRTEDASSEETEAEDTGNKYVKPTEIEDIEAYVHRAADHVEEQEGVSFNYEMESLIHFLHKNPVSSREEVKNSVEKFFSSYEVGQNYDPADDRFDEKTLKPARVPYAAGKLNKAGVIDEDTFHLNTEV